MQATGEYLEICMGPEAGLAWHVWGALRKPMWLEQSGSRLGWIGEAELLGPISLCKKSLFSLEWDGKYCLRILCTGVIYLLLSPDYLAYFVKIDCQDKGASWRLLQESSWEILAWLWCWPAFVPIWTEDKIIVGAVRGGGTGCRADTWWCSMTLCIPDMDTGKLSWYWTPPTPAPETGDWWIRKPQKSL